MKRSVRYTFRDMSDRDSAALAKAEKCLNDAQARGGANERRLTDAMWNLLSADPEAARAVGNLLLARCDQRTVTQRLGASRFNGPVNVRGEQPYAVKRLARRGTPRRFDLLFETAGQSVVVEVKLDARLAPRQLEDLLLADATQLGLDGDPRIGVLVIAPRAMELSRVPDRRRRLLRRSPIRWAEIYEDLIAVDFVDPELTHTWNELLGLYLRRGRFGATSTVRPSPLAALEAVADPLRDHLARTYGLAVHLDANRGRYVTAGHAKRANIEFVLRRKRSVRQQRITIWLEHPPGGRRRATIVRSDRPDDIEKLPRVPAAVDKLEVTLRNALDKVAADLYG